MEEGVRTKGDWHGQKSALSAHKFMFDEQILCDITFHFPVATVDEEGAEISTLGAHQYMLSARSPVFYAKFIDMEENVSDRPTVVEITDISLQEFKELLRFVYSDEVSLTEQNVVGVLKAASHYRIPALRTRCVDFLRSLIDVSRVCFVMEQALDFYEQSLAQLCLGYIKRNTKAVLNTDGFLKIKNSTVEKILSSASLGISELDLFNHVLTWARHQCTMNAVTGQNFDEAQPSDLREVIGDALYHIRFPAMKLEEFSAKVAQLGILTTEELVKIYGSFTKSASESDIVGQQSSLFPTAPRDTSGLSLLETHTDFQITLLSADVKYVMTFNATIDTAITIKSLLLFVGLGAQYPVTGTVQILQNTVLYGPTAVNCQRNLDNYPTEAKQFPIGVFQLGAVKVVPGYLQIIVTYSSASTSIPLLVGNERKACISYEGITLDCHVTSGPLYAIEFTT